jgi:hypothetical protein
MLQDVLFVLNSQLKRAPLQVHVQCPQDIRLHGAPGLIEQVLTNLTMNAIQHGFDGGQRDGAIDIVVALNQDQVHLRFFDNGSDSPAPASPAWHLSVLSSTTTILMTTRTRPSSPPRATAGGLAQQDRFEDIRAQYSSANRQVSFTSNPRKYRCPDSGERPLSGLGLRCGPAPP